MNRLDFEKAKTRDKTRSDSVNRNVNKVPYKTPPTESQLKLIAELKGKLEGAGKDISYLAEPDCKFIAMHVLDSLIRLCKKYHL